jgi:quinol monooxygenase YgiN
MIVVSGTAIFPPGAFEKAQPAMQAMIEGSRAEAGCQYYSYGLDVLRSDTLIALEYWDDWAALEAHFNTEHMRAWRKALAEAGVLSRDIKACEAGPVRQL